MTTRWYVQVVLAIATGAAAFAQGTPSAGEAGAAAKVSVEDQLLALSEELAALKELMKKSEGPREDEADLSGWQLQLRGSWFNLAHNHRDNIFSTDDHQNGWGLGVGLVMPLWLDMGPVDLTGHLILDYRQLGSSTEYTAPITATKGTASYLNIIAGPSIRFPLSDMIKPHVFFGLNMQVVSPPEDPISYLDLGAALGCGVDIMMHERISLGLDYRYSWFGVADQEDEDYGSASLYLGFNF